LVEVREALLEAGRGDLIGNGFDALIPVQPPHEALEARQRKANAALRNDYMHSAANPARGEEAGERVAPPIVKDRGYRPHRKGRKRRPRPGRDSSG
jgi:hypothetical protein